MIRNGKTEIQNSAKLKRKKIWAQIVRDRQLYILLLPFVLYYIIFYYMPMYGLQIAFKDYKPLVGIWESEFFTARSTPVRRRCSKRQSTAISSILIINVIGGDALP